jgi:Protein of unknown function (DUF4240)
MPEFWDIVGTSEARNADDIDLSLAEIGSRLAELEPFQVSKFAVDLRESLFRLDRKEFGEIPVTLASGARFPQSSDHFLYARCACILAGEEVYNTVLRTGFGFERFVLIFAQRAEGLLYLASDIYQEKTGEKLKIANDFPIESMSNVEGWAG